jgi:hypothetical protein
VSQAEADEAIYAAAGRLLAIHSLLAEGSMSVVQSELRWCKASLTCGCVLVDALLRYVGLPPLLLPELQTLVLLLGRCQVGRAACCPRGIALSIKGCVIVRAGLSQRAARPVDFVLLLDQSCASGETDWQLLPRVGYTKPTVGLPRLSRSTSSWRSGTRQEPCSARGCFRAYAMPGRTSRSPLSFTDGPGLSCRCARAVACTDQPCVPGERRVLSAAACRGDRP